MKFTDFMIAVPQGSPTCAVCERPTYSEARGEGQLVLVEGEENNSLLQQKAGKALVLAAGITCSACNRQLCWRCITTVGLGACPKCHQPMAEHPHHGAHANELLSMEQKATLMKSLLLARQQDTKGALDRTVQELAEKGWGDVDAYFGRKYAEAVDRAAADGRINASEILDSLQKAAEPSRRIMAFPNKATGQDFRVVMGTAYVEEAGGLIGARVMAECEDGEVRCVMESMMAEMFVALINRAPAQS